MSTTTVLNDVKLLLGLQTDDEKLDTIVRLTESRLKALLSVKIIPDELEYIITEVSIKRFNRIGSEGVQTHSVEGESMSFNDDDFSSFSSEIQSWRDEQANQNKGKVRFLGGTISLFTFKGMCKVLITRTQATMKMVHL